jgi:hypothetical protein
MEYQLSQFNADIVIPSVQDTRDYTFGSDSPDNVTRSFNWNLNQLPMRKDLRDFTGEIEHQLQYGSCAGNAICSASEYLLEKDAKFRDLSRLYVYYNGRRKLADLYFQQNIEDKGASIHFAIADCTKNGIAAESIWGYNMPVNQEPSKEAYDDGKKNPVRRYERIGNQGKDVLSDILAAVANNIPVIFGVHLTTPFLSLLGKTDTHVAKYNPQKIDPASPDYAGAHAMVIVGYDRGRKEFLVENSWGTGWGDRGYCALGFDNVLANGFDFFVIREFSDIKTPINPQHRDDYKGELDEVVDDKNNEKPIPPIKKGTNYAGIGIIVMLIVYYFSNYT